MGNKNSRQKRPNNKTISQVQPQASWNSNATSAVLSQPQSTITDIDIDIVINPSTASSSIVISHGGATIKYGFSDMENPCVLSTAKGHSYYRRSAIKDGLITNWNQMETIWQGIFDKLKINPKDFDILIAESVANRYQNTHRMIDVMFDTFDVNSIFVMNEDLLALFASNRYNGMLLNLDHQQTNVVPVYNGVIIDDAVKPFNDNDYDYYASDNSDLSGSGYIARLIERGIHKVLYKSMKKCDTSLRQDLMNNIVIYGGGSLVNGLDVRLKKELKNLLTTKGFGGFEVNVFVSGKKHLEWLGGAKCCEQNVFRDDLWIYNVDYKACTNDEKYELTKSVKGAIGSEFLKYVALGYIHQVFVDNQVPIDIIRCVLFCLNGTVYDDSDLS